MRETKVKLHGSEIDLSNRTSNPNKAKLIEACKSFANFSAGKQERLSLYSL